MTKLSTTNAEDLTAAVNEIKRMLGGQIFGATFTKRDGSLRSGSFRLGVRRDLVGVGLAYDAPARGNLIVWDMTKRAYRTIRLDAVQSLTVRGKTVKVA